MQQPPQFKFDDEFNFADGKLIVVSQGMGFRIHRDIIGRWSPELADAMASLTADGTGPVEVIEDGNVDTEDVDSRSSESSGQDEEGYMLNASQLPEDCVLVNLDLEADDIRRFLRAVYRVDLMWSTDPDDFATVASILRFAYYYKIQGLIDGSLARICRIFPMKLDKWKALLSGNSQSLMLKPEDIITAIQIAHMTDTTSILPTALYRCCMLDALELARCPWHDRLMKESYAIYIGTVSSARVRLAFNAENIHTTALKDIGHMCGTASLCTRELNRLRDKHTQEASLASLNIIDILTLIHEDVHVRKPGESGFCGECVVHVQHGIITLQEEYWLEMPKSMGIDSIVRDWS